MSKKIEWIKRGMTANNGLHMQEVCNQINNSLQKPTTTPSTTQIVAVDNTNAQTMLNLGDGLSVENGSLKASGGKLYYKKIELSFYNNFTGFEGIGKITIYFYESNDTLYDVANIDTLYAKIPFAICSIEYNETTPEPSSPVWILGCMPDTTDFTFYCLTKRGEIRQAIILFSEIDNTNISMYCEYIEV